MTPYLAASFGRVYPGGAALVDLPGVNRPLLELIASWEAPPSPTPSVVAPAPKPATKPADRPAGPPAAQPVPSAQGTGDAAGVPPDAAAKPGVPGHHTLPWSNRVVVGRAGLNDCAKATDACKCCCYYLRLA